MRPNLNHPPAQALIIRKMEEQDLSAVAAIANYCFSEPWSEQAYSETLNNPLYTSLIAEQSGKVIGFVDATTVCGEASLNNIAVHPDHQKNGIATQLFQAMIKQLEKANAFRLTLEVRPSNKVAISLYQSFGLSLLGRRKGFYRKPTEDALILSCPISND